MNHLRLKLLLFACIGLLCCFLYACQQGSASHSHQPEVEQNRFSFRDFQKRIQLQGKNLNLSEKMGDVADFILIEDRFIIYDGLSNGYHCHLYDIETQHVTHFAKDGRGPGELLTAYSYDYREEDRSIWVLDVKTNTWIGYDLEGVIRGKGDAAYITEIRFDMMAVHYPFWLNKETIVGLATANPNGRIFYFDHNGNSRQIRGSLPKRPKKKLLDHVYGQIYQGMLYASPDRKHMAFACRYTDIIQTYETGSEKSNEFYGPKEQKPIYEVFEIQGYQNFAINANTTETITQVTATNMSFYLLYCGKSNAMGPQGENYSAYWRSQSEHILMFDWSGIPLYHYQLDRPVMNITISSDGKYLYALEYDKPDIIQYRLQ